MRCTSSRKRFSTRSTESGGRTQAKCPSTRPVKYTAVGKIGAQIVPAHDRQGFFDVFSQSGNTGGQQPGPFELMPRLHQPSGFYGVSSRTLGTGAKDEVGHNRGMFELASGQEVLSHFDLTLQQRFLPSGRVRWFPMSNVDDDGSIRSLMSGVCTDVSATKVVDATHSQMQIPSVNPPTYTVDPGVTCLPPNDLPRRSAGHDQYVVVGAGKTAMDACIWLLDNGTPPEHIR